MGQRTAPAAERGGGRPGRGQPGLRARVARILELPGDVMLDLARITLVGGGQLAVENHRGLIEYAPGRITIGVPKGQVAVEGQGLVIGRVSPDLIAVTGQIARLTLLE